MWKNVKDELPINMIAVIACTNYDKIFIGAYSHNFEKWFDYHEYKINGYYAKRVSVTHWQDLPEPPKKDKKEK